MAHIELVNVWSRLLAGLCLKLESGCHVVVQEAELGGAELVKLLCGVHGPERGSCHINGQAPHRSPQLRCHIGSLLAQETPLPGKRLEDAIARALSKRALGAGFVDNVLERAQLAGKGALSPKSLSPEECRKLGLVLALETPAPQLMALFEPLMFSDPAFRDHALASISELARSIPVLCTTASVSDALVLGGKLSFLSAQGVLTPGLAVDESSHQIPGFAVECDDPRPLARALSERPEVIEVRWSQQPSANVVEALGPDALAVTRAITRAALDTGTTVLAIRPLRSAKSTPPVQEPRL